MNSVKDWQQNIIWVRGAGDLATGVGIRLLNAGFSLVFSEIEQPTVIRGTVSFATAVYEGTFMVEGHSGKLCHSLSEIHAALSQGFSPVFVGDEQEMINLLKPHTFIEATIRKHKTAVPINVPFTIGLGPGFIAGQDVDAVIETQRGHHLGRVIWEGAAEPNTGIPGAIGGYTTERVIHAPEMGVIKPLVEIGSVVKAGDIIAQIGSSCLVHASIDGILRGMIHGGLSVEKGMKIADIDPRCEPSHCHTVSDKARAVGGGVLEALLHFDNFKSNGICL